MALDMKYFKHSMYNRDTKQLHKKYILQLTFELLPYHKDLDYELGINM